MLKADRKKDSKPPEAIIALLNQEILNNQKMQRNRETELENLARLLASRSDIDAGRSQAFIESARAQIEQTTAEIKAIRKELKTRDVILNRVIGETAGGSPRPLKVLSDLEKDIQVHQARATRLKQSYLENLNQLERLVESHPQVHNHLANLHPVCQSVEQEQAEHQLFLRLQGQKETL